MENVHGDMTRSQNVRRTASRTQREASDATAASPPMATLMLHVACSLYIYNHCSCREAVEMLMIVNELCCRSSWHRRDACYLRLLNQMAATPLVGLGMDSLMIRSLWPGSLKNESHVHRMSVLQDSAATAAEPARSKAV